VSDSPAPKSRIDWLALGILLATWAVVRANLGYRSFPSVDDFTYVPLGLANLDPELFPRDDILRGYVNYVPLWPAIIFVAERTVGLAQGLFLLTLLLTFQTVHLLRRLLRALKGANLVLPLVMALAVTVYVRGIGRGAHDGILGDAFHMQWLALNLVLGTYDAFVRRRPARAGLYLGFAAWAHPLVAFHGAISVAVAGLLDRSEGVRDVVRIGFFSVLVSLPVSFLVIAGLLRSPTPVESARETPLGELMVFRAPHHYDLAALPFLIPALLGLLALAAIPRLAARDSTSVRRFYGLLLGQGLFLVAAFVLHGPVLSSQRPLDVAWIYALDLTRTTPLFWALSSVAVAAALPRPDEPLRLKVSGRLSDRTLGLSALLAGSYLLLINLRHGFWIYVLFSISLASYVGTRKRMRPVVPTVALLAVFLFATADFLRKADLRAPPEPGDGVLFSWARAETPADALFIIPPGMQSFRLEAQRSAYVDFKSVPPSQPSLMREWRRRLEEVANPDANALEQGRGWPGIYLWDVAYAKRNPPERIRDLLERTGADYFVLDLLLSELPPHLPSDGSVDLADNGGVEGLTVAFESPRFRVYRLPSSQ